MIITENVSPDPLAALMSGIDQQNYAADEEKTARFKTDIVGLMPMIEAQRVPLEERWNNYHHCWARKNTDATRFYNGVNDAYFPVAHSNVETLISYIVGQLFGPGPKFAVKSPNEMISMMAPAMLQKATALLEYFLHVSKAEQKFPLFVRQAVIFGSTIVKNVWRDEKIITYTPPEVQALQGMMGGMPMPGAVGPEPGGQPGVAPDLGAPDQALPGQAGPAPNLGAQPQGQFLQRYLGPTFQVIDLLSCYLYPIDAESIEDCEIIFEKVNMDFRRLKQLEQQGLLFGVDRLANSQAMSHNSRDALRRDVNKNFRLAPYGVSVYQIKNPNNVVVNEIWCNFDLYGKGYPIPCKAIVANDTILELRQNPLYQQRPPYRLWRAIRHQDHIYGMGVMELIEHHQYTLNAIINQALDANLYQVNQMMAINADRYQGLLGDIQTVPLQVFPFSDNGRPVEEMIHFFKPENTAADAFAVANIVAGSMSDTLGTPPVVSGKFTNKERTAREVSAVVAGASIRIDLMVRNLALEIMQNWYEDSWELARQHIDAELDLKVTGMPSIPMSPSDLNLKPMFYVIVGNEAQEFLAQQQAMAQAQAMAQQAGQNEPSQPGQQTPAGPSEGIGQGMDNANGPG